MIRLVTFENFPLVDLQIKRAYQRRCNDDGDARAFSATDEEELWCMVREVRQHSRQNRDWLRELAREVDSLSVKRRKRGPIARRRGVSVIAVNAAGAEQNPRSRKAG